MADTPNGASRCRLRLPSGQLGFASSSGAVARTAPLVRVVLDSASVVTASGHPFFRTGMTPVAAVD